MCSCRYIVHYSVKGRYCISRCIPHRVLDFFDVFDKVISREVPPISTHKALAFFYFIFYLYICKIHIYIYICIFCFFSAFSKT